MTTILAEKTIHFIEYHHRTGGGFLSFCFDAGFQALLALILLSVKLHSLVRFAMPVRWAGSCPTH